MSKYSEFFLLGNAEYEEIGEKLRLRKYGSWLAEEAWIREGQNKKRAEFTLRTIQLARQIAQEKNIDEMEAFSMLQGGSSQQNEIFTEYSEQITKLLALSPSNREQFEDLVTLFFKNRGEVLVGKKWQATDEWTTEDTQKLPQFLLEKVELFMAKEDGSITDEEKEEEESPK